MELKFMTRRAMSLPDGVILRREPNQVGSTRKTWSLKRRETDKTGRVVMLPPEGSSVLLAAVEGSVTVVYPHAILEQDFHHDVLEAPGMINLGRKTTIVFDPKGAELYLFSEKEPKFEVPT